MISRMKTIITTDIDVETLNPTHSVEIESEDGLPSDLVVAAAYGACKATMNSLREKYPRLLSDHITAASDETEAEVDGG